jgi:class 3 adenylate cyclase
MSPSELRASDSDRERAVAKLQRNYEAGRLSSADLSERVEAAYRATTVPALKMLTADLPSSRTHGPPAPRRSGLAASVRVHATTYALVNLMLIGIWAASGGGYFWPIWPMLGWGIGLGCHAAPLIALRGRRRLPRAEAPSLPSTVSPHDLESTELESTVAAAAAPDGTVTILFSDIEGSSALNERLGDLRWLELLREHNQVVREQVRTCGGYEVKMQGDGFMIAFPSARRAIECARAIQAAMAEKLGEHPDGAVRVRIGLHTGEAIREQSDFYGRNVVVAARIAALASGGEILASSVVKQLTESAGDIRFDDAREVELPGLTGKHLVHRVV